MATFPSPATPPPLSLYIHIPWCVRKCPYCDFNSHPLNGKTLPEKEYLAALLRDLENNATILRHRPLHSIFIGGGTPSLLTPSSIGVLIDAIAQHGALANDIEITLEANPSAVEHGLFSAYRSAGVNRLSLGIQSLDDTKLTTLGRIHNAKEAREAIRAAQKSFTNINLDFMFALPGQNQIKLQQELEQAIAFQVPHLSWYQLTLEPNTVFAHTPPRDLPDEDAVADMQEQVAMSLAKAGYQRYEVSAYAQSRKQCRHNFNYWQFGDYLALGAGAHSKVSYSDRMGRTIRYPHPQQYMDALAHHQSPLLETCNITNDEVGFEFMLNALRLRKGVAAELFTERTGLSLDVIAAPLTRARQQGLLHHDTARIAATEKGYRFLNEILSLFLNEP